MLATTFRWIALAALVAVGLGLNTGNQMDDDHMSGMTTQEPDNNSTSDDAVSDDTRGNGSGIIYKIKQDVTIVTESSTLGGDDFKMTTPADDNNGTTVVAVVDSNDTRQRIGLNGTTETPDGATGTPAAASSRDHNGAGTVHLSLLALGTVAFATVCRLF